MALYMETTTKEAESTAAEIQTLLGKAGASAIQTDYDAGEVIALSFLIDIRGNKVPFRLPIRTEPVFDYLQRKRSPRYRGKNEERDTAQAKRVAWRQIYRWILAQLALIETGMVTVQEVFLPYVQTGIDETLYQRLEASGFKQLPAPSEKEGQ